MRRYGGFELNRWFSCTVAALCLSTSPAFADPCQGEADGVQLPKSISSLFAIHPPAKPALASLAIRDDSVQIVNHDLIEKVDRSWQGEGAFVTDVTKESRLDLLTNAKLNLAPGGSGLAAFSEFYGSRFDSPYTKQHEKYLAMENKFKKTYFAAIEHTESAIGALMGLTASQVRERLLGGGQFAGGEVVFDPHSSQPPAGMIFTGSICVTSSTLSASGTAFSSDDCTHGRKLEVTQIYSFRYDPENVSIEMEQKSAGFLIREAGKPDRERIASDLAGLSLNAP